MIAIGSVVLCGWSLTSSLISMQAGASVSPVRLIGEVAFFVGVTATNAGRIKKLVLSVRRGL